MLLTGSDKGHSRSLAILQTGLLKTWLWASTVEMVAEPGVAAGIACSYFGVLQSGNATRHDSIDSRSAELDAGDFAAQSAAFKTAMGQAGARVASLLLVPPLTALGSSWLPFAMQAPGRPENLVRAFFLLDKVMREVLLDATPYDWVLWTREDAGWWAPFNLHTVYKRADCCTGIVYTTACVFYGMPDKAWLADRRTMATFVRALYLSIFQAGDGGAQLVDEEAAGGATRDALLQLGAFASLARSRQAGVAPNPEAVRLMPWFPTHPGQSVNTEHLVELVLKVHGFRHAAPHAQWNQTNGAMTRFGMPVSDARRLADGRECLRHKIDGGFHGHNELLLPAAQRRAKGAVYCGGCNEQLGWELSKRMAQRFAGYCGASELGRANGFSANRTLCLSRHPQHRARREQSGRGGEGAKA